MCTAQTRDHGGTRMYVPHLKVWCVCVIVYLTVHATVCDTCKCYYVCYYLCYCTCVCVMYVSSCVFCMCYCGPTVFVIMILLCVIQRFTMCVTVYCYICVTCESGISCYS